jgi:hypothetical protein
MNKHSSRWVILFISVILIFLFISGCIPEDKQDFKCEPITASEEPPPFLPPALLKEDEKSSEEPRETPEPLKPLCPEGQVPVAKIIKPGLPKGNPLLTVNMLPITPDFNLDDFLRDGLRPIEEVYWKGVSGEEQKYEPLPPDPAGKCDGVANSSACYYYAAASYRREADGGGMTMSIERPAYNNSGGSGHTLDEIAIQGGKGDGNIVELGWNVSTDQYSNANPHLFVFHWINWGPTCYDACGWQQWNTTYYPGMDLNSMVGREVYIGYVIWKGNWWAWFDNQWLGYYPGTKWSGEYKKNQLVQWFGEVASNNGIPPKTDMGNGNFPTSQSAATMYNLCDVNASDWVCWYRDQQSLGATVPAYYDIDRTGFGRTRYGGPGE